MLNIKQYVYSLLTNNTALTTLVPAASIVFGWPDTFSAVPVISYTELNQSTADDDYFDNMPVAYNSQVQFDIWTAYTVSTTAIQNALDNVMRTDMWNLDMSADLPEPDAKIMHRVLRYSRKLIALDIN